MNTHDEKKLLTYRRIVIREVLIYLGVRKSLDELYEDYCNGKVNRKVYKYNKDRRAIHPRNPWSIYGGVPMPIPDFIEVGPPPKVPDLLLDIS